MGKEKVFEDMGLERESICVRCVFLTTDEKLRTMGVYP